jgi:hypothetical protein
MPAAPRNMELVHMAVFVEYPQERIKGELWTILLDLIFL